MKKFNTLFVFFLFLQITDAQYIPINLEQKISSSELIVEGEVTQQQSFLSNDGYILTRNTLKLKKRFKGRDYYNRNVKVITRGGVLRNEHESWTHLLNLEKGDYGVFFLNEAENYGEDCFTVFSSRQGFIEFASKGNTPIASDILKNYPNIQFEVYERIQNLTNSPLEILKGGEEDERRNCLQVEIEPTIKTLDSSVSTLQLNVSVATENESIYLKELKLSVSYNSNQFGENIVSEGLVETYSGNELSDTQYQILIEDAGADIFEIKVLSFAGQDDFLLLDDFLKEVINIRVNLPSGIYLPEFSVSEIQTLENSTFLDPWTLEQRKIECIELNFPFQLPACPIITGFTPDTVAAGVEEMSLNNIPGTIKITGNNFGSPSAGHVKPHLSDVLFNDVDGGWFPAAELEYVSWNDSMIVVRVPTIKKTGGPFLSPGACTERIGIFTTDFMTGDTCTTYSTDTLFVRFGLYNDVWRDTIPNWEISSGIFADTVIFGGKRRNLVDRNGLGGYSLKIEDFYPDITKNSVAIEQAIAALDVYRCDYKINVQIVDTLPFNARLRRGTLPTGVMGTTFMRGNSVSVECSSTTNEDSSISFFEVIVNEEALDTIMLDGLTFMFNLADTIPNDTAVVKYIDFQRTMLHEFGHAFQLRHTHNQGDIMISGSAENQTFNNFNRTLSMNDDLAVRHIHLLSNVGHCLYGPMTDYICLTGNTNIRNKEQDVLIYPNPAQNNVNIKFEKEVSNLTIQIVGMNGMLMYEQKELSVDDEFNVSFPQVLTNGIYFLRLFDSSNKINLITKIIIQK